MLKKKINARTYKGSWQDIRKYIVKNYDKYEYICYVDPGTKKESIIIPGKHDIKFLKKATGSDIRRISVS